MYLIVGLGNPGKKYEHTRHNAGFDCISLIAKRHGSRMLRLIQRSKVGKIKKANEQVLIVKPQTFMNLSGDAVKGLMDYYKIDSSHLIVIYDDTDLEAGKIRIRKKGSAGGHNGMKDIIQKTGTQEFARIRIGIGKKPEYMDMISFVLGRFGEEDRKLVDKALEQAADAVFDIIENGIEHAMNRYN